MDGLGLHALPPNTIGKTIKIEVYETAVFKQFINMKGCAVWIKQEKKHYL
jgi:hypothetical protein